MINLTTATKSLTRCKNSVWMIGYLTLILELKTKPSNGLFTFLKYREMHLSQPTFRASSKMLSWFHLSLWNAVLVEITWLVQMSKIIIHARLLPCCCFTTTLEAVSAAFISISASQNSSSTSRMRKILKAEVLLNSFLSISKLLKSRLEWPGSAKAAVQRAVVQMRGWARLTECLMLHFNNLFFPPSTLGGEKSSL